MKYPLLTLNNRSPSSSIFCIFAVFSLYGKSYKFLVLMGRRSRYKKIKVCDPFYKGPKKDSISSR